jgi:septal ring factor EnvC (AmiA/AmiB activator)
MSVHVKHIVFCILIFIAGTSFAQNKKDLESRKAKLQKEIDFTNKQLQIVSKNKSATAEQLNALRKKIQLREALIGTINSEISTIGGEIENTTKEIGNLETQMANLKKEYASMIQYAYQNRNVYQRLMFIFGADNFNQAYSRLRYMQEYGNYRRRQAAEIESTQITLSGKKEELQAKKNQKTSLRNNQQQQKSTLENERKEQDIMLQNLTAREKKLRKELAEKQIAKQKLDTAIEKLIRKEIESAKKKAVAAGNKNVTNTNVFTLTPESQKLSNNFSGNKGMLPWPVESGSITSTFGEHPHKELKGIVIKNNGVDIQTGKGSAARAIFDGTVSGVISIPGSGNAVIIRHGDYLSVYANLDNVTVKTGEKVTTKQRIGSSGLDSEGSKGEIHLEIWKNSTKLNPQIWLARK